jgi:hypothetical protein
VVWRMPSVEVSPGGVSPFGADGLGRESGGDVNVLS